VPVTLVRRNAQLNAASDAGSNTAAKSSKARTEGHNTAGDACPKTASRIASSEYVTGIKRAAHCNGAGSTLTGYMTPLTSPATPRKNHFTGSLIALSYRVVYTPYAVVRHPYPQTVEEIYARQVRRLAAATGYLTMMLVEEPSYRWVTLKYAIEGAWGKPGKWRAQIPMCSVPHPDVQEPARSLPVGSLALRCLPFIRRICVAAPHGNC
jgi:hypothetical protein